MKKILSVVCMLVTVFSVAACSHEQIPNEISSGDALGRDTELISESEKPEIQEEPSDEEAENSELSSLIMTIDGQDVSVSWERNESVAALADMVNHSPLQIEMSKYGGFEQVGSLGSNLPKNDEQTTTTAGDIVLYSGNQIVVFYGTNSWSYTRLGHIEGMTQQELEELLGNGDITLSLSCERTGDAADAGYLVNDVLLNSGYTMPVIGLGTEKP